jgi:predicted dehydrogenase
MAQVWTDRRAFLKAAGGASLGIGVFPGKVRGANSRVSLGFIGMGRMGSANLGYAASVPGFRIAAVCDVRATALERARALAGHMGCEGVRAVMDFREMLADPTIDAVCISTPDRWHASMTVEACRAGKDVYVETPAIMRIEEGPAMVAAARRYERVVQAGTVRRSGDALRMAREIVKSGALGEIAFCRMSQAVTGWDEGRDARWAVELAVELLDTLQFVFDEAMPESISAQGATYDGGGTRMASFRYAGFVASHESRAADLRAEAEMAHGASFHGNQATLVVNRAGCRIFAEDSEYPATRNGVREAAAGEIHVRHWRNWLACIRNRAKPVSDIETCVRSTAACVLAELSVRHGVTLNWDDNAFTVRKLEV